MKKKKLYIGICVLVIGLMISIKHGNVPIKADEKDLIQKVDENNTVYVGDEFNLIFNENNSNVLHKWISIVDGWNYISKDCRAEVNAEGKVITYAPGSTKVCAKYWGKDASYDGSRAEYSFYILEPKLETTLIEMEKGKKTYLNLVGAVAKSYKSSNKKIVKVNKKGKITALKNGTVTITVKDSFGRIYRCLIVVGENDKKNEIDICKNIFPDDNFRDYISWCFDEDGNGKLSKDEIYSITNVMCNWEDIDSLKGIEYFTELKYLDCSNNNITSLDLSNCKELSYLNCSNNKIESLNLKKNSKLKVLICEENYLKQIDLSKLKELKILKCEHNDLSKLDVSQNKKIESIACGSNRIEKLNIQGCDQLKNLYCYWNKIKSVNLKDKSVLRELDLGCNNLQELDLSKNTELISLNLTSYTGKMVDLSNNMKIKDLSGIGPYLSGIDISPCKDLISIECDGVSEIDISHSLKLRYFDDSCQNSLHGNNFGALRYLDTSHNTELQYLNVRYTWIRELDLTNNTKLRYLNCQCDLEEIDVSNNTSLEYLDCSPGYNTCIKNVDISKNTLLKRFCYCNISGEPGLEELDVSKNVLLTELTVCGTEIKKLDLHNNTKLTSLDCSHNMLKNLDVKKNSKLTYLNCSENMIEELDLTRNNKLECLICEDNLLSKLDVSKCVDLESLYCKNNKINKLDIRNNKKINSEYLQTDIDVQILQEVN